MFSVNAEDIHNRLTSGPVEVLLEDGYFPVTAVTMMGLEHVVLHAGGRTVLRRNTDLVAIR